MSLQAHVAELTRKHHAVAEKIEEVQTHPAADPLELRELKRRKLRLRDEIEHFSSSPEIETPQPSHH